jgi:cellulose synthase (UDP-forming)
MIEALAPAATLLGLALLLLPSVPPRGMARVVVMGVSILAMLRYLVWRLTETLPPLSADPAALWMWGVAVLETMTLGNGILTALFLTRRSDRRGEADRGEARLAARPALPAVDIIIPTYNEPLEVLERSILGALALDWPGDLRVWVLDDQRRDWLRDFCAARGARWVTRTGNSHGKAGNINAWLSASRGDGAAPLLMVLDADFVPQRRFLWRVAGFFDDDTVGLVQTPQSFFNTDPIQMNLLCGPALADEQRFFYHEFQPALDAWGAAFCCGTSFVVRRDRLDAVGGIPTDTVTEDMMTTYALAARGWRTVYLDEPLSAGLAAEGLGEFITQRARWCLGTVQALRLPCSPLRRPGIGLMSRLCFLNAQLFWLGSFPLMLVAMIGPAVYWWSGVPAFLSGPEVFLDHFAPRFVAEATAIYWVSRGSVVPLLSGLAPLVTAPAVAKSAFRALFRPQGHRFKVTTKGGDRRRLVVHGKTALWIGSLMAAVASGLLFNYVGAFAALAAVGPSDLNLGWSLYALAILFLGLLVCIEVPRQRAQDRMAMNEPARLRGSGGEIAVVVEDLSLSGAQLRLLAPWREDAAALLLDGIGTLPVEVVRRAGDHVSLRFGILGPARDALLLRLYTTPAALPRPAGLDMVRAFHGAVRRSFAAQH